MQLIFLDQVYGLCGTYNWNSKDDMLTPEGDIETNPNIFALHFQRQGKIYFADGDSVYKLNLIFTSHC